MARSIAHTKAIKAAGRKQLDKKSKVAANRLFRRISSIALKSQDESRIPVNIREVSDIWDFGSDGGAQYDTMLPQKYMRK